MGPHLTCGRCPTISNQIGIQFLLTIVNTAMYTNNFKLELVQLVTSSVEGVKLDTNKPNKHIRATNALDTEYPYKSFSIFRTMLITNHASEDTPGQELTIYKTLSRYDCFTLYLLFTPKEGKPAPLKMASWNWGGTAMQDTNNVAIGYSAVPPLQNPVSCVGLPCVEPPTWTTNIINIK
jgi:hypothetical protein